MRDLMISLSGEASMVASESFLVLGFSAIVEPGV